jgi:hypothetical protein
MAGSSIVETVAATAKDDEGKKVVDAEPGNKEAAVAGTGMVTEASWIDYVILYKKDQALLSKGGGAQGRRADGGYGHQGDGARLFHRHSQEERPFKKYPL